MKVGENLIKFWFNNAQFYTQKQAPASEIAKSRPNLILLHKIHYKAYEWNRQCAVEEKVGNELENDPLVDEENQVGHAQIQREDVKGGVQLFQIANDA